MEQNYSESELLSGMELVQAFEARSNLHWLPNLHLSFYLMPDGQVMCYCLDFGLHAYSNDADIQTAVNDAFEQITELAVQHLIGHIKRDTIDHLFDFYPYGELTGEILRYARMNNKEREQRLIEGLASFSETLKKASDPNQQETDDEEGKEILHLRSVIDKLKAENKAHLEENHQQKKDIDRLTAVIRALNSYIKEQPSEVDSISSLS